MSVWKKASKAHQKTHKERHQPESRAHLGLLEKKKDYIVRAKDFNEKKETLKLLRKRALNKNPDEFYHHMINSKTEDGVHFEQEKDEYTPEQLMLMKTQDLKYITTKKTQELKKIEKLQSQLHLPSIDIGKKNNHIYFDKKKKREASDRILNYLMENELPDVSERDLKSSANKRQAVYKELAKRIDRERELDVLEQKFKIKRAVESKKSVLPPRRLKKGSKDSAPVYVWKYERKK
ncbi:unnamed protein product [Psylliodes chrysocephalus]|uniref:U3 small nucleolar RNA-associated protein 11 n=1 Tax=Psylliodes chrysocephalus TaxID=3402493 RepID=A0A9P0DCV1_9CUCU|nr:unnamed protein product [Psylliodes chrysocephala]